MPYFTLVGGRWHASDHRLNSRSFPVDQHVVDEWQYLCNRDGGRPRHLGNGFALRPYPELDVASHAPYAACGVYVDHRDPGVERALYELRDRLSATASLTGQATLRPLARQLGLRHWRDAYNVARNVGRRHTGESGRDQAGELRWRRWNTRRWSTTALAATAASSYRCFGVELEFVAANRYDASAERDGIARDARAAGFTWTDRWGSYGRDMRTAGWQGTYDSTVSGEVISDIMDGSPASHDEVRDMLRIIRNNGGHADRNQGIHVHHDARDFDQADKVRLVDNLQAVQDHMLGLVAPSRRSGQWCRAMSPSDFAYERQCVASGQGGSGSHLQAWNFGHLYSVSPRVEFRAFGHSLNGRKLRVWVQVGQAVMAATKAGVEMRGMDAASFLTTLRSHGLRRWAHDQAAARLGVAVPVAV